SPPPESVRPVPLRPVNRLRSIIACAAGALVVAGVGATAATAATATTTTSTTTTAPAGSTTTTTLPPLPVPQNAPADNELEPQTFYGRIQIPAIEVDSPLLEGIRLN